MDGRKFIKLGAVASIVPLEALARCVDNIIKVLV